MILCKFNKYKRKSIDNYWNKLTIFMVTLAVFFATSISIFLFLKYKQKNLEIEFNRLNSISPLIIRPIMATLIVGDNRSLISLLKYLIEKYNLSRIVITDFDKFNYSKDKGYIQNRGSFIYYPIPDIKTSKFVFIESKMPVFNYGYLLKILLFINLPLIFLGITSSVILKKKLYKRILNPIKILSKNPNSNEFSKQDVVIEVFLLSKKIKFFIKNLNKKKDIIARNKINNVVSKLAIQVAHDIRSPLAAINMIFANTTEFPENKRIIIRHATSRINDIANNLLSKVKTNCALAGKMDDINKNEIELIFLIIDSIISEKKYEYSNKNIKIELNVEATSYISFAVINQITFKRMLSNLLNNSVEALNSNGEINIALRCIDNYIEIVIADNGKGIPEEIIPKVMEEGFSFDKENGAGIGLYYAKQYIEKTNGQLQIKSVVNQGTNLIIKLPKVNYPTWFCDKITIKSKSTVIILDDDHSIHNAWAQKLNDSPNVRLEHMHKPSDIFELGFKPLMADIYLLDYEFHNETINGLDIIERLDLNKKAILVTNFYEDTLIRARCEKLGVKIIPKPAIQYIPVYIDLRKNFYILIDNDELVRNAWILAGKQLKINVNVFSSPKEFNRSLNNYEKNTPIYIDSDFGAEIRGELYAKDLYQQGFSELFLTTGFVEENFPALPWIKSIVGKEPPFV